MTGSYETSDERVWSGRMILSDPESVVLRLLSNQSSWGGLSSEKKNDRYKGQHVKKIAKLRGSCAIFKW